MSQKMKCVCESIDQIPREVFGQFLTYFSSGKKVYIFWEKEENQKHKCKTLIGLFF